MEQGIRGGCPNGISADQNEKGYFFYFPNFLKNLKNNGILLETSKNDIDLIIDAFKINGTAKENDFIKLIGTYEPKSLQITNLLKN